MRTQALLWTRERRARYGDEFELSEVPMHSRLLASIWLFGLPLLVSCGGSDGKPGSAGASCTVTKQGSATVIQCGSGDATVNDGADGTPGSDGTNGSDGNDGDPGHS